MYDIHDCVKCNSQVYMNNAESCIVCGDWFCGSCDFENGIKLWSENNSTDYYVCKDCLEEGLKYINSENMDYAEFEKDEYNKACEELNKRRY